MQNVCVWMGGGVVVEWIGLVRKGQLLPERVAFIYNNAGTQTSETRCGLKEASSRDNAEGIQARENESRSTLGFPQAETHACLRCAVRIQTSNAVIC